MFKTFIEVETFFKKRSEFGIKPGLERIHSLLDKAGNPEKKMKAVHVAGTNGKGSTASFLIDGLVANGYKTGFFTSPSFSGLTGHIYINKEPISEGAFISLLNQLLPAIELLDEQDMHPTEFEIITVLAIMHLAEQAEISVIETGMGGRFDTTNCFEPILSIITNVSIDHASFLGSTVVDIAEHKAGIIKHNRPVIAGEMKDEAFAVIREEATGKSAPIFHIGEEFQYRKTWPDSFIWTSGGKSYDVKLGMSGVHQMHNASLAIAGFALLDEEGVLIDMEKAVKALAETAVPGRFEKVHSNPDIILDGAHNPDGIRSFTKTAKAFAEGKSSKVVFSAFRDKDISSMLEQLKEEFNHIVLVPFDHPRALSIEEEKKLAEKYNLELKTDWQDRKSVV